MRLTRWLEALNDKILETVDRFGMVISLGLILLALTGELLGWWNDVGVIIAALGLGVGLWKAWRDNGTRLLEVLAHQQDHLVHMAGKQDAMLENQGAMVENQRGMLDNQQAMLERQDRTIDVLDRIQAILDARLPGGS